MDGRPDGIQMTHFRVVRRRSSTAASFWCRKWCRKTRRFRKKRSCWFAEVRQGLESTDTLSVRSSPPKFAKFRGQLQWKFLSDPKGR